MASFSLAFLIEAKRVWQDEQSDCLTSLAALQLLAFACTTQGLDIEGQSFEYACCQMAARMGLQHYVSSERYDANLVPQFRCDDERRFAAHVAWGFYVSASYVCVKAYPRFS